MTEEQRVISQHMKDIGKRGGMSRSDDKRAAARENQKKAVAARKQARLGGQSNG